MIAIKFYTWSMKIENYIIIKYTVNTQTTVPQSSPVEWRYVANSD